MGLPCFHARGAVVALQGALLKASEMGLQLDLNREILYMMSCQEAVSVIYLPEPAQEFHLIIALLFYIGLVVQ